MSSNIIAPYRESSFHYNTGNEPDLFQLFSRIILLSSISDYVTFYIAYIIYYEYNVY
jgi:hypothetical protein